MMIPRSKKVEWVYHLLKTGSEAEANKTAKTGRGFRLRLIRHIEATGSLDDKPRSGRPREYNVQAMEEAVRLLKEREDDLLTMKDLHRLLVQDRDTVHRSHDVASFLAGRQVTVHLLPPRSPDLDPLDYAVFASAKQEMRRQMEGAPHLSWDAACAWLIRQLRSLDASAMIEQLRKRLHACVAAQGARFEHMPRRMWVPKASK